MLLQNISRNKLQQILSELNLALDNHQHWYDDLIRTIACRLPSDKHNIIPNAHKECRFGQWYYSNLTTEVDDQPGFIAIGKAHHYMHQLVANILLNLQSTNNLTPLNYDNLANSIERFRLELSAFKSELETLLFNRDPLTMTINRISMLPMLRDQQEMSRRLSQSSCIAMIDIDLFKNVNDQHGHLVGDKVLISLAQYLTENLRSYDKIFRYGGEEFLLFMQQVNLLQAMEMVDRIREGIATMPFNIGLPEPLHITVSCGVALFDPDSPIEQSIDHADKALYLAKSSGRNQTQAWGLTEGQKTT